MCFNGGMKTWQLLLLSLSFHYIIGSSLVPTSWSETAFFRVPASGSLQPQVQKNVLASEQVLICHKNVKNNNDKRVEESSMTKWRCQSSLGWTLSRLQGLNSRRRIDLAICFEFPIACFYKIVLYHNVYSFVIF